jgi:hypothetical protein
LIISPLNSLINANTTYNVSITDRNTTNLTSITSLTLTFPASVFKSQQLSNVICDPYSCNPIGNTIFVDTTNISPSSSEINFNIQNIINPTSTIISNSYIYTIFDGSGAKA